MHKDNIHEGLQASVPPLSQLYAYLTEGCNLQCRHCWLAPKFDAEGKEQATLPLEMFEQVMREAKPLGLQGVKLTGGEPLLHPEFIEFLQLIRRENLSLTIESNGFLCTKEIAAEIAKSTQVAVSISIDGGDAATHDAVRGISGSFARAKQAVKNLAACHIAPQLIMSLLRSNVAQIDTVVEMAEELGASSVKFNIIQPTGRGERVHEKDEGLSIAELIELGRYVDSVLREKSPVRLIFDYPAAFHPLSRIASGDSDRCGILGILGVLPDGQYALCGIGEHMPECVFGRIGVESLEHIWRHNTLLKNLRAGLPHHLNGVCARCLMKNSCLGACIAQNYYRAKNLWAPFWFCERAEALGLFPESRLTDTDTTEASSEKNRSRTRNMRSRKDNDENN